MRPAIDLYLKHWSANKLLWAYFMLWSDSVCVLGALPHLPICILRLVLSSFAGLLTEANILSFMNCSMMWQHGP